MKRMTGEIGSLKQNGEQVGGFKHWVAFYKPPLTTIKVLQYWFFKKVEGTLQGEFYTEIPDGLKLVCEQDCLIKMPDCELDTMINKPLEIIFIKNFDWRE
jgi:hypothetical protein